MVAMILKTCNMFKQEDNKEMEKHKIQSNNNSHESLMEKMSLQTSPQAYKLATKIAPPVLSSLGS
jgi:hypothetical protein